MKKRIFAIIICTLFCTIAVLGFCCRKPLCFAAAATTSQSGQIELESPTEIFGTNPDSVRYKTTNAPFDSNSRQFLEGKSIILNGTSGSVSTSVVLEDFEFASGSSLYFWLFIPDEPIVVGENIEILQFSLVFTLSSSDGKTLTWNFEVSDLLENFSAHSGGAVSFGWKYFELCYDDANKNFEDNEVQTLKFGTLSVRHRAESINETTLPLNYQNLALYHIERADDISKYSGVIDSFGYVNYKLSDEFEMSLLETYYIDDGFTLGTANNIFDYIYVGIDTNDFSENSNSERFSWNARIIFGNKEIVKNFSSTVSFDKKGYYSVELQFYQKLYGRDVEILRISKSIYVDEFSIGKFIVSPKNLVVGDSKDFVFLADKNFVLSGSFKVTVSDKSVAEVTNYIKDNKLHICVNAKKKGIVVLTVSANGSRDGKTEKQDYSREITIRINDSTENNWRIEIIWIVFGVFGAVFVIFVAISLVKARKNDVK